MGLGVRVCEHEYGRMCGRDGMQAGRCVVGVCGGSACVRKGVRASVQEGMVCGGQPSVTVLVAVIVWDGIVVRCCHR